MENKNTKSERTNKATHKGTCQCCGAMQKLPCGVLAKHGYNVQWGFFSGVCGGSGHLPFEKSFALIAGYITSAQDRIAQLRKIQAELRQPATTPMAWVSEYHTSWQRGVRSGSRWVQVEITGTQHSYGDGIEKHEWMTFSHIHTGTKKVEQHQIGSGCKTVLEYATKCNAARAAAYDRDIAQLESYIAFQTKRVQNWKEQPLTAI